MAGVRLVDTHCHLDADQFADEPTAALLARAAAEGVERVVTVGTHLAGSRAAVALAGAHEAVWAVVGVDPKNLAGFDEGALPALEDLAAQPKVVAIGEVGLDYHWDRSPRPVQREAFRAQLELARRIGLPVVIHCREADEDSAAILLGWAAEGKAAARPLGVMHCYSGDLAMAERLVGAGFLISLSGIVTFANAARTHEVAVGLPEDALLLETDAPYLAPHPHRGQRNEPAMLRLIAERVAALRDTSLAHVAFATSANAARLFRWEDS